ncbi:ubinuclein-1 isoform X2 [Apis mellifera]|uniref:Ubinuclein-1 isoform X2 n=1 Tax=Apis mellifera TaxID=7460 RepID=A0A7M7GWP4_APIME|nr:ubinuclein-1 isoform X2 [Apis mellifera]|eukprot:XP_006569043.1 ubinuclein-1 isoform X2 [Apis mellifera]
MSEAKRVPLQTLEFPESLGYATKKEKKGEKGKQLAPSFRFTLTLPESNEKACPEFNYAQLLKAAEKKRRKELKRGDENASNGLSFDDDDDDDKLRDMARRFEAKYGTSTMGRKRHKYDDYVDLGAGYDENDSFIDNTDAYDEIVPEEMTTAHGGFYINCGALEFRTTDRHLLVHNNNNNNNNNQSNDDESSESSEEDTEDVDSPKRSEKRNLSSSDEDDTEDITGDQPRNKKQKIDENGEKKQNHENIIKKKKKQQNSQDQQNFQQDRDTLSRRKEKGETTDAEVSEDQEDKKKSDKIDTQKNKNTSDKKFDIKKFEKKTSNSNGYDTKKLELKKLGGKDSNIDDAIESVVNAARVEDESSRDTTDSGKSRCIGTESECDDIDKEEAPLPDSLPENIVEIVNKLKACAENNKEGKAKFFNAAVNALLLSLEKKLRALPSSSLRLETYGHLARFLPCSKVALQNRAKKLFVQDVDYKTRDLIKRLKTVIDEIMPSVVCKYVDECQKVAEGKEIEGSPEDVESSDDEGVCEDADKSKIPRKRFPWTEEAKKLVSEIASIKSQCYNVLRPRKLDMYTYVGSFMVRQVLPLWPRGYMTTHALLKFVGEAEPTTKKKTKKLKEVGNGNTTSSENVIYNSARVEASSISATFSQEKVSGGASKIQNVTENSTSYKQGTTKSSDSIEKKQHSIKNKDKTKDTGNSGQYHENSTVLSNNSSVGKISVVPTAQLMAQKPIKNQMEKINLMDLVNSSLSITPVNDFHKSSTKLNENKKDIVSITAYSETSNVLPNTNEVPQSGHHSVHRQEASYSCTQSQHSNYSTSNQSSSLSKTVSLKHRLLNENTDIKNDKKLEDKDIDLVNKTEKRDKKRERCVESKHKSHDVKKKKKDQKVLDKQLGYVNSDVVPIQQQQQPSLTKEEQEQRQNEETIAATNYLSQIFNDDASSRGISDKRKDAGLILDDLVNNAVQPSEQEKDVQMVMRSLKELQELQEMKYSPSNSPINSNIQKSNKSNTQCATYQDEYSRLYLKKDVKLKSKEESQW